jgi:hypothetical protein
MTVGPDNRPRRIPNSDPEIHRSSRPIERPLLVTTISAEDDEVEPITGDDTTELSLVELAVAAGDDTPSDIEPESGDDEPTDGEGA